MSKLIDRQDVIDRLKKAEDVFRQNGAKLEANGIHYAMELVESDIEIPTVTKDNRPNICFNCEHCCALSVNSDGEVTVMCNLGAESCEKNTGSGRVVPDNLQGWSYESSYASKQRAYKEGKYDGFMESPYGD